MELGIKKNGKKFYSQFKTELSGQDSEVKKN